MKEELLLHTNQNRRRMRLTRALWLPAPQPSWGLDYRSMLGEGVAGIEQAIIESSGFPLLKPRRATKRIEYLRFWSHSWKSKLEQMTWWYRHVQLDVCGLRMVKRGARRGRYQGAARVQQAIIDATAYDILIGRGGML